VYCLHERSTSLQDDNQFKLDIAAQQSAQSTTHGNTPLLYCTVHARSMDFVSRPFVSQINVLKQLLFC